MPGGMFDSSSIDPVVQFRTLAAPKVSRSDILTALNSPGSSSPEDRITNALATNSSLTADQARPIAKAAVQAASNESSQDTANSKMADNVMASLGGFSGDSLQLSSPVMLWPWARAVASLLLLLISGLCAGFIFGGGSTTNGNYNVTLAVVAVAALLAAVILVMGYKNVTISKGTGSGSGSPGSAGSAAGAGGATGAAGAAGTLGSAKTGGTTQATTDGGAAH